jgi:septal ring factor EnvC (AmiA/AmiB activator)
LEEVNSIRENLKNTKDKHLKAQETRDTKKDSFDKYVEECNKSKEQRDAQIKVLSETIGSEKANRDNQITDSVEKGLKSEGELKEEHTVQVAALKKEIDKLTKQLNEVNKSNKKDEEELRKEYKKATNEYIANMGSYDLDVNN